MYTRIIPVALVALIATSSQAMVGDSAFTRFHKIPQTNVVELGTVRAEADGIVEVYDFHGSVIGDLLGTEMVHAGANPHVRIKLGDNVNSDVMAILKVNGQVVATREYEVNRR